MKESSTFKLSKPKSYLYVVGWVFLIVLAGKFIINDALPYFGFNKEVLGRWWNYKWSLIGHISGGLLALVIGPFQFWKAFRNNYLTTHRWLGKIYLMAIVVATVSSTYLAWTSALKIHWTWAVALQALAFAWIVTASMAYISVRRKRIQQHKDWMIRSYVVTFGFVTFRFLDGLPFVENLGDFIETGPTTIWVSFAIPLLIAEICISWNRA